MIELGKIMIPKIGVDMTMYEGIRLRPSTTAVALAG